MIRHWKLLVLTIGLYYNMQVLQLYSSPPIDDETFLEHTIIEETDEYEDKKLIPPIRPDTPDSVHFKFKKSLNERYVTAPMHSRYRDQYRVIQDIRRLFRMVDRRSIHGYESIDQLAEAGQHMPHFKQRLVIGAAAVGGVASIAAQMTNRHLRKRNVHVVRWKVERVYAKYKYKSLDFQIYSGVIDRGFRINYPKYRLTYSRYANNTSLGEVIYFYPTRYLGLQWGYYNQRRIVTPILRTKFGAFIFTYDQDMQVLISRLESRFRNRFYMRLLHVSHETRPRSDYWRGELIVFW